LGARVKGRKLGIGMAGREGRMLAERRMMTRSIWWPKWWVFLPVALPFLTAAWLLLGMCLHLDLMPAPDPDPVPDYPAWLVNSYYAVYYFLLMATFGGPHLMVSLFSEVMGTNMENQMWVARLGIALTLLFYCLVFYAVSVTLRWRKRRAQG
jgi:hypothetical protein